MNPGHENRTLWVTTTGEPVQPVRLYFVVASEPQARVRRRLGGLHCIRPGRVPETLEWLHMAEAAALDFTRWAPNATPSAAPIVLGVFAFPAMGGMTLTVRSIHRAILAARFFAGVLADRVVLSRLRVVNRWFAGDEAQADLAAIDQHLDRDVVVVDPRAAEVAFEEFARERGFTGEPRTLADLERLCAEHLAARRKRDVPLVEDFPLCPEEETADFASLAFTLDVRFVRAGERWHGNPDVTLADIIVRMVEASSASVSSAAR